MSKALRRMKEDIKQHLDFYNAIARAEDDDELDK